MRAIDGDALLEKVEKIQPWDAYLSKYAQGIRHCMELVSLLIKDAPTIEPEWYESWGNLTYDDIWRQCKADIENGNQDFEFKDIIDWRPATSMYTGLPIAFIPHAIVLYLNDFRKIIYIYKTMVFEIKDLEDV